MHEVFITQGHTVLRMGTVRVKQEEESDARIIVE